MSPFTRLEIFITASAGAVATAAYLSHLTTLEFFAVLLAVSAASLVVARVLLGD